MRISFKAIAAAAALLALSLGATAQTAAGGTLDKIKSSGKVVLGVREASPPMAYMLGAGEKYVGYHVELCERVLKDIAPQAKLEYMAVTAQNTIPLVQNGTLDIGCGPTTNNTARQQQVAFALTTYVSEVRMATKVDSGITNLDQLAGRNVSASTGTTAVQLLRKRERAQNVSYNTMLGKDHLESFLLMESGRADAFVLDDNLLAGIIANSKNPSAYRIVGEPLGSEPIALLFRKDDPAFKAAVDDSLRRMMKSGDLEKIYTKWFVAAIPPKNTSLNLPMSTTLRQLIAEPNDKPLEAYAK
ncbi:amino acid ABC transporter substrate-binding protein [Variovorax sp. NFACC27]|uniref:amino acid ABC transporter substrate-binding protein n=1 Tax=unclassified Variovorax TaxID=663243 RepID=UPI000894C1A7|nr:glutamate/aspartate transport system substrate-binding protein [Variovorax paradoxus]SEF25745.1 amino acid ABC transporter substrate-binding protein, PAAT family (TC 3.A.1.3.-) [Variovorax sp. NFACC28]SEG46266.1 amino acid ABC transporter substrate-binding protein, PAAT family (TC 3.A.1.3.-) [Variovorax sp. NFACC29]SFC26532.1 amino acid ABC transporter substrate-binding protein, PAAT family (TC 3.A.1.3.-) [Variovorax sp. NFACC26]SFG62375.1 amino acid ABC transporter substrate-binding protein